MSGDNIGKRNEYKFFGEEQFFFIEYFMLTVLV